LHRRASITVTRGIRSLVTNIGANYAYLGLMTLITLFVVPIYVRTFGQAEWGDVATCLTLQAFVFALDAILASPMLRDIARAGLEGTRAATQADYTQRYRQLALVAFVLIEAIGVIVTVVSPTHVLVISDWPLHLIALQVAFQIANQAAIGYWNGCERQRESNLRLALFALLKHTSALLLVLHVSADATTFLLPFAFLAALEWLVNSRRVAREMAQSSDAGILLRPSGALPPYALAAVLAMASAHIDRVVLAVQLPVIDYGRYFLVSTVLLSLMQLQMPLTRAFMPQLARALPGTLLQFRRAQSVLSLLALAIAAGAESVLQLWLGDVALAKDMASTLQGLMLAAALALQVAPGYAQLLNAGRHAQLAAMHAATLALQLQLLLLLAPRYGMGAGVAAWLGAALLQLLWLALATRAQTGDR
jgi:O-antigen/teichoic acid export membrane protein